MSIIKSYNHNNYATITTTQPVQPKLHGCDGCTVYVGAATSQKWPSYPLEARSGAKIF